MKIERSFSPDLNRYDFDFPLIRKGWLQVDTNEDASWYGNWVNLDQKRFVQFAEGDVTDIRFESCDEMVTYLRNFPMLHIDAGITTRDRAMAQAELLNIQDLLV